MSASNQPTNQQQQLTTYKIFKAINAFFEHVNPPHIFAFLLLFHSCCCCYFLLSILSLFFLRFVTDFWGFFVIIVNNNLLLLCFLAPPVKSLSIVVFLNLQIQKTTLLLLLSKIFMLIFALLILCCCSSPFSVQTFPTATVLVFYCYIFLLLEHINGGCVIEMRNNRCCVRSIVVMFFDIIDSDYVAFRRNMIRRQICYGFCCYPWQNYLRVMAVENIETCLYVLLFN